MNLNDNIGEHRTTLHIRGTRVYLDDSIVGDAKISVRAEVPVTDAKRKEINDWLLEMFGREDRPVYRVNRGHRVTADINGVVGMIIGPALVMHTETWNRLESEKAQRETMERIGSSKMLGGWGSAVQGTMWYTMLGHLDIDRLMQE